ncbi:hypothetical protein ASPWEDRAFT_44821 [Aspergillus wentii DTO 134E9]|uniref:Azaphilone pigments biosynthesis cluster protein L N-terminal domain-containing protein n=1 Tax=Aspergillus wentii DTO 134E9 TaxID=1073089 RepID=A0A1L9R7H0_ASPWE|nr:uncharacterized protein ASPWEDRAFT_44821 [Aspergillus wentii DTO 134E9]KAI9927469.1 hypothetical protein MW887_003083 [Aspergillus wentii]OJJ30844.1 hypothetical protein ASPWEDRAFT_44821 [Aspergillus wentii DTO 134E9]
MAEPIGIASGVLALASFAFQSSITLYETVQSFRSHQKRVRDLLDELEALSGVLGPLAETIQATTDVNLSVLDLPLLRCGNACNEFREELIKCSSRSGGSRTSFRDWAKLRYMGDDIDGFRRVLAQYQLTINIALTDANLRKSSINAESLEGYKDLIETAKADLEAHLENIDGKLELVLGKTVANSDSDVIELRRIKEERLSTEKCLQICAQLSEHIKQIQPTSKDEGGFSSLGDLDNSPEKVTNEGLQECKTSLKLTMTKLEEHMQDLMNRLLAKSKSPTTSQTQEEFTDLARLRDEWETARQCMDICTKADNNLKENFSKINNYATGDALQFMVSTNGKILHGNNRGVGWRTRQVGGYISDASIQQLSRDMTNINFRNLGNDAPIPQGSSPTIHNDEPRVETPFEYSQRYGRGYKLP